MTKMRVHELAKELGMENKELIDLLHKKNVEVSNHMSSIEDNIADESLRVHSRVRVKTRQRQRRRVRHHREHVRKSQVQKSHRLRGRFLLKL